MPSGIGFTQTVREMEETEPTNLLSIKKTEDRKHVHFNFFEFPLYFMKLSHKSSNKMHKGFLYKEYYSILQSLIDKYTKTEHLILFPFF